MSVTTNFDEYFFANPLIKAVKEGKIAALGKFADSEAGRVIDAGGKYILPGGVEAHMHC